MTNLCDVVFCIHHKPPNNALFDKRHDEKFQDMKFLGLSSKQQIWLVTLDASLKVLNAIIFGQNDQIILENILWFLAVEHPFGINKSFPCKVCHNAGVAG